MSRIIKLIDEIEEFFENCKSAPFSSTKVVVAKEELFEMLTELRLKTPDEIVKAQKLLEQKENILVEANAKAAVIIDEANQKTKELVSEHEIMQKAYEQAQAIIQQAQYESNEMRIGAVRYVEDMLNNLESLIGEVVTETQSKNEVYINSANRQMQIIRENRNELISQLSEVSVENNDLNEVE
ncbi:MAG: hypothetical protein K0R15_410 [Clostridiales bacterium]|jgi:cell division septum initiation protein DivIVA|nr:hypothetical protein [Clostridiales bacterium]